MACSIDMRGVLRRRSSTLSTPPSSCGIRLTQAVPELPLDQLSGYHPDHEQ
jgi:hypothetical protein